MSRAVDAATPAVSVSKPVTTLCLVDDDYSHDVALLSSTSVTISDAAPAGDFVTEKCFAFDQVCLASRCRDALAEKARQLAEAVVDGYNVTVVSTGSNENRLFYTDDQPALMRTLHMIVEGIFGSMKDITRVGGGTKQWGVEMNFVEVFCESFHDLLLNTTSETSLKLRAHPDLGKFVEGAQQVALSSSTDFERLTAPALKRMKSSEEFSTRAAVMKIFLRIFDIAKDTTTTTVLTVLDLGVPFRLSSTNAPAKSPAAKKLVASFAAVKAFLQTVRATPIIGPTGHRVVDGVAQQYIAQRRDMKRTSALTTYVGDDIDGNAFVFAVTAVRLSVDELDSDIKKLSLTSAYGCLHNVISKELNTKPASSTATMLKAEIMRLKKELESSENTAESSVRDEHIRSISIQLESFQSQVDELNKRNASSKMALSEVEQRCLEQRQRLEAINEALTKKRRASERATAAERDIGTALQERIEAEEELKRQYSMTRHASLRIKQEQRRLSLLENHADSFERQKESLHESQHQRYQTALANMFRRVVLIHKYGCERQQLERDVKSLKTKKNVVSAKHQLQGKKIQACESDHLHLQAAAAALEARLDDLLKTDEVQLAEAQLHALKEIVHLENERFALCSLELERVTRELTDAEIQVTEQQLRFDEHEIPQRLRKAQQRLRELTTELELAQLSRDAQTVDEEEARVTVETLAQHAEDIVRVNDSVAMEELQLLTDIATLDDTIQDLESLLDSMTSEHDHLQALLHVEEADTEAIRKSYERLCIATAKHILPT